MTTLREQTWDLLQQSLDEIVYTRDIQPGWRRFELVRDDESNYAVLYEQKAKAPGED